jgi:hypothetical protein
VRPAPNLPTRNLVPLPGAGPGGGYGRFTLLTYNILADLYAKVWARGGGWRWFVWWRGMAVVVLRAVAAGNYCCYTGQLMTETATAPQLSVSCPSSSYPQADGHSQTPAWVMAWPYRKQNLLRELLTKRPDIMCLQEVQSDHYK